ncbi:MAG: hypothetical protein R6V60_15520 [Desulfobacterales bacterium]
MSGKGKLSRKKHLLIAELLQRPTIREAAEAANLGEATVHRWLRDPAFQRCYKAARQQIVDISISQIQKASSEAVEVLRLVLHDNTAPASSRVSASKIILELSLKGLEVTDILERLGRLERAMMPE